MASRRLRLLNLCCRLIVRPRLARSSRPEQVRAEFEFVARHVLRPPPFCLALSDADMDWVSVGGPDPRGVILFFHGGGYIAGSPDSYRTLAGHLAAMSGLRVALPRYPLAPEHPAPAAFEAAVAAFRRLRDLGYRPEDIVLGGDSAGGGLALALLAHLCASGEAPAGLFAFSPWTDLTGSGASFETNARVDRVFEPKRLGELVAFVTGRDFPADDPRLSPLFATFQAPPPVWMSVARTEILCDDARRMAARLREAGGTVMLEELEDAPHVWQMFDGFAPEVLEGIRGAATFARGRLTRE